MIMPDKGDLVPLTTLLPGEMGRVTVLGHGRGRQLRFRTMGLIEGRMIRVVATQPMRGPIVVDAGGTQVAIGRRMATQILVERMG